MASEGGSAGRWLRKAWRTIGLMVLAGAISFAIALVLHHNSQLPSKYTWLEPLRTLRNVAGQPWFVTVLVIAFAIGRFRLRGTWFVPGSEGRSPSSDTINRSRSIRIAALSFGLIAVDLVIFPQHTIVDRFALCGVAWAIGWPEGTRHYQQAAKELVVATLVFLAICYAFTIWKALTFVGGSPMDRDLLELEHSVLGVYPHRSITSWAAQYPGLLEACDWVYFQFFSHMALTAALLVGMHRARMRLEYLSALGLCYILGGPIYHLVPAAGPIFIDPKTYQDVMSMKLMTNDVRAWLSNNTGAVVAKKAVIVQTWGYVACMPSLHIAQEMVMLWYARSSRLAFALALAFTGTTCLAVVVLGWHYPIDVVGGIVLAAIAIAIARGSRASLFPARIMPVEDAPLPPRPRLSDFVGRLRRAFRDARARR